MKTFATGIIAKEKLEPKVKPMSEMEPCEVCVVEEGGDFYGRVIMRTASVDKFEVMDLYDIGLNNCWQDPDCSILVKPYEGDSITIKLKQI